MTFTGLGPGQRTLREKTRAMYIHGSSPKPDTTAGAGQSQRPLLEQVCKLYQSWSEPAPYGWEHAWDSDLLQTWASDLHGSKPKKVTLMEADSNDLWYCRTTSGNAKQHPGMLSELWLDWNCGPNSIMRNNHQSLVFIVTWKSDHQGHDHNYTNQRKRWLHKVDKTNTPKSNMVPTKTGGPKTAKLEHPKTDGAEENDLKK